MLNVYLLGIIMLPLLVLVLLTFSLLPCFISAGAPFPRLHTRKFFLYLL